MSTLGFDKYVEPLKLYLFKYRDSVKGEKPDKKSSGSKKHSESLAQPKKSLNDVPDNIGMYSRPISYSYQQQPQSYSSEHRGGMTVPYGNYGAMNSAPPSQLPLMVDHSAPLVAPGKGEVSK